jgi:hypothetical protein
MRSMATERNMMRRRKFLGGVAGTGAGFAFGIPGALAGDNARAGAADARLLSAARVDGANGGAIWSDEGLGEFTLPARAHAAERLRDSTRAILVGRRPGNFAALFDSGAPDNIQLVAPIAAHRFAGHAAANETRFFTGELHSETALGRIVLRDRASGAPLSDWDAGGIEPHELLLADGGARLVVALGGIAEDSSVKGPAANVGQIESAIVELDAKTGRVLQRHVLAEEFSSLSLRHMALSPDGQTVAFGIQDQDVSELRPLVGLLRVGRGIEFLELPSDDPGAMRFYIGSVAIDTSGRFLVATSPRGGTVALWSLSSGAYLGRLAMPDVCGLAADSEGKHFWVSSGLGEIARLVASETGLTFEARWHTDTQFDNHLTVL